MQEQEPQPEYVRYLRKCGHPNDWIWFLVDMDGRAYTFCLGCLFKRVGLKPCEIFKSVEDMAKKMGGEKK